MTERNKNSSAPTITGLDFASHDSRASQKALPSQNGLVKEFLNKSALTPMMSQYLEIKSKHQDCILFYRMGDFYELFFDDAKKAAPALNIALTKRGKMNGEHIPMCGVPIHNSDTYLLKLIKMGFRVAICEQMETPADAKKRSKKAVVRREVVRIITPGTITEETLLEGKKNNYLSCLFVNKGQISIAYAEVSTGEFCVQSCTLEHLPSILSKLVASEILVSQKILDSQDFKEILDDWKNVILPLPDNRFDFANGFERLKKLYGVHSLDGFGQFSKLEISTAGLLVDYIEMTQVGKLPSMRALKLISSDKYMQIDTATQYSLEISHSTSGIKKFSLFSALDRTLTNSGGRMLSTWLLNPLIDIDEINLRHSAVEVFYKDSKLTNEVRETLKNIADMERCLTRISLRRASPRDLLAIKHTLVQTTKMRILLSQQDDTLIADSLKKLGNFDVLIETLKRALANDMPMSIKDGGVIKKGFSHALDKARSAHLDSKFTLSSLQGKYREITGIENLKIKHNNIFQHFIEVTPRNADKMTLASQKFKENQAGKNQMQSAPLQSPPVQSAPLQSHQKEMSLLDDFDEFIKPKPSPCEEFIHIQTVKTAIRYTTAELGETSKTLLNIDDKIFGIEQGIFFDLEKSIMDLAKEICTSAQAFATLDVLSSLGHIAQIEGWVKPQMTADLSFNIVEGRHPIVEKSIKDDTQQLSVQQFTPNNCCLEGGSKMWLLTGPNMAGKSTFLRQNALIVIMAQLGCFIPAKSAKLGIVDRVFSRVGLSDDLARGRSTFMVEMVETAVILNQATSKSLVILDEIGRGTATYDGLSIAWGCVEHLCLKNKCRGLFATHYHELNALSKTLDCLSSNSMSVKEWQDKVIFLRTVQKGQANKSYGIYVAKLAGLPNSVISRASKILKTLESQTPAVGAPAMGVNEMGVNEMGVNEMGGNEMGVNEMGGNEVGGNEVGGNEVREVAVREKRANARELTSQGEMGKIGGEVSALLEHIDVDNTSPKDAIKILYNIKAILKH